MPRPPAQQWSRKPRQPKAISSERPKLLDPQASELLRPRHSKQNITTLCRTWRCKLSKRRVEAKPTSSPPARLLCTPVHQSSRVLWLLPTTSYLDRHLHHLHSFYCRGASPVEEQPVSASPATPVPKQSPRPKRQHLSPDPVENMPLGRTTLKVTLGEPPSSKQ